MISIGKQKLILGDCREVLPGLPDESVDCIFTDPPYGHNNNNNGDLIHRREAALGQGEAAVGDTRPIAGDDRETASELVRFVFAEARRLLKPGACCCCCGGGGGPDPQFARWSLWLDELLGFKQMVVWDKGPMGMGWHYRRSYETVLVGQKPGGPCFWFDDSHRVENIIRANQGIRKIIPSAQQHPTEKPVTLAAHFLRLHTPPGGIVLDPFLGSGTTLVAAQDLGFSGIGIEVDPGYYDIACDRVRQAATGCDHQEKLIVDAEEAKCDASA